MEDDDFSSPFKVYHRQRRNYYLNADCYCTRCKARLRNGQSRYCVECEKQVERRQKRGGA